MYPLVLWFAHSWWRLLYETNDSLFTRQKNPHWRLAHELKNAGEGYVWPDIDFVPDGVSMQITSKKTNYKSDMSSINYINECSTNVPLKEFQDEIVRCIDNVFDRMETSGIEIANNELNIHWTAIREEMSDHEAAQYRKIEAMLGYNPDEADTLAIENFLSKTKPWGTGIAEELASAANAYNIDIVNNIHEKMNDVHSGLKGKFNLLAMNINKKIIVNDFSKPWEIGRDFAIELRNNCGESDKVIRDHFLSDLMGISSGDLFNDTDHVSFPIGIVKQDQSVKFFFRGKLRFSRRFQASRIIADKLISDQDNVLLPVSNAGTWRQKFQRAFAGEFLCPSDNLLEFLNGRYDEDSISDAAEYFEVNESVPRTHLINRKILSADAVI
jgi:hypothetical protein